MRPKQPKAEPQEDLFRARLENLVDLRHPLVRLAKLIDWSRLEAEFGPLYTDTVGRPGLPTRLMVGLHLLKHMDGLSDEAICARYLDSPYVQMFRDIGRKIAGNPTDKAAFAGSLSLIGRLLRQRREDRGRDKLYSLHAPEVECIGKGKANTRFEFGVKVSLATTNALAPGGQFVLGARASPGNPYDGHTLADQITQTERRTGVEIERAYVDRGYRGHDADKTRVILTGQKRGITPTIRRERCRRNAIEPVIGHMKDDGHLGRNFLRGTEGDAANVILAAAGHNLRLLRAWLARLLVFLLSLLLASAPQARPLQAQATAA